MSSLSPSPQFTLTVGARFVGVVPLPPPAAAVPGVLVRMTGWPADGLVGAVVNEKLGVDAVRTSIVAVVPPVLPAGGGVVPPPVVPPLPAPTRAVTVAVSLPLSTDRATPSASVFASAGVMVP